MNFTDFMYIMHLIITIQVQLLCIIFRKKNYLNLLFFST